MPAPTIAQLLQELQGTTITQGWDVVHAMSAGKVNELFERQFVTNLAENSDLAPISASVPVIANISVELVDIVLASPLIAFDPQLEPGTASLTVPIVSGLVHQVQQTGAAVTVLATQWISSADGYAITGQVPLASVQGEVTDGSDVVLEIENGASFAGHLGMTGAAGTLLGEFFLGYLQQHSTGFRYSLGTIVSQSNGTDLTPVNFDIATQVDDQDPTDAGRVLLFIATSYHPGGGAQTSLALANVVPQGMDTTLFVASETLFGNIIATQVGPVFGGAVSAAPINGGAYELVSNGGAVDVGEVDTWDGPIDYYASGNCQAQSSVSVPLAGVKLTPAGGSITGTWGGGWPQPWYHQGLDGKYAYCEAETINMTTSLGTTYAPSVNPLTSDVSFTASGSVGVDFEHSSVWAKVFGDGSASDTLGEVLKSRATSALSSVLNFGLPDVHAFAVSSLLFPGSQASSFSAVDVPGDLMLCGTLIGSGLVVTPALQEVAPGQSVSLTANAPVTWGASRGTIDANGLYTAPSAVSRATLVVITASRPATDKAYAAVLVVPQVCSVSPIVALSAAGFAAQAFAASLPGSTGTATWSLSPEVGTIDSSGLYTPPSTVSEPTLVTVTATIAGQSGTANLLVLPSLPAGIAVTPPATAPLGPGQTTTLAAGAGGKSIQPGWSLFPQLGTIDAQGMYTAPAQIAAPTGVVAMATAYDGAISGTAVIVLSPFAEEDA